MRKGRTEAGRRKKNETEEKRNCYKRTGEQKERDRERKREKGRRKMGKRAEER